MRKDRCEEKANRNSDKISIWFTKQKTKIAVVK